MQVTFIDRINEKQRRLRDLEEFISGCIKCFMFGIGAATGAGLFLCVLAVLCANG